MTSVYSLESPVVLFRWLGVAGLELTFGEETLLVDPFFTRPPFWRLWFGRVEPNHVLIASQKPRCDYILVSHAHFDHLMDVPDIAHITGAHVYGSSNTCELLRLCNLPTHQVHEVHTGDHLSLGSFRVDILPARHGWAPGYNSGQVRKGLRPPLRLRDYVLGEYHSFLIQLPGLRLLNWCGIELKSVPQADVLFTLPTSYQCFLEALLSAVQPRLVIPVHWDDLFRPLTKPIRPTFELPRRAWPPIRRIHLQRFRDRTEGLAPGVRVFIPQLLATYDLSKLILAVQ